MLNNTSTYNLDHARVFLIEDDLLNLAVINRILTTSNAWVFQNYNSIGIVAHVIQNLPIDIIILDIMLRKGVSGFDVIKDLKANPKTAPIPVVAVSSLDPDIAIPQAKASGFSGFISKPINAQTFASDLHSIIQGGEVWVTSR